ncbi:MAG: Hsp20/alpha crystallin family protein [Spirochaetales bacterium]|nr:Hsp20/alpha crystallin family protein [Spirochaetales bacterium]
MPNLKIWKSQQLSRLRTDSERLFDQLCSDFGLPSVCRPMLAPDLTMRDTPESVIVQAHLPGMEADHILIDVEDAFLVVSCKHMEACEMMEQAGVFEQRFSLPCRVRTDEVTAEFDGEYLTIVMPKCKKPESRRVPVKQVQPDPQTQKR